MVFVVFVGCDVGNGKLNTGIEFDAKPSSLRELITVAEALYSTERQMQLGDPTARFQCVSCMQVLPSRERQGGAPTWREIHDIEEVRHKDQLFVFDWATPAPTKGAIPPVQFVVSAKQVKQAVRSSSHGREEISASESNPAAIGGSTGVERHSSLANTPRFSRPSTRPPSATSPPPAGLARTPSVRPPAPTHVPGTGTTPSYARTPPPRMPPEFGVNLPPGLRSNLPQEAQDFLFRQLCTASGSRDELSSQRLHTIFVENDIPIATDHFSIMVLHQRSLNYNAFTQLVEDYGPVMDALYDRLCAKDEGPHSPPLQRTKNEIASIKDRLQALEDEEQELIARQAKLKHDILQAQRALRDAQRRLEEEEKAAGAGPDDRSKETEMLQKFIALKARQVRLLQEEARVNHELSLL